MFRLLKPILHKWYILLLAAAAIISQCYLQLMLPEYMGNIQGLISSGIFEGQELTTKILIEGGYMIAISVGIISCAFVQFYCASYLGTYIGKELRYEMFKKVNSLSLSDYNKFGTATLITRTTNDIEQIKNYVVMGVRIIIMSPTMMIIALIKTLRMSTKLAIIIGICIPLIILVFFLVMIAATPLFKIIQEKIDNITIVLRENLTGIRVIRAYNQQETENKKFDKANLEMKHIITKVGRILSVANPFINVIFNICFIGIYAFGFYLLDGSNMAVDGSTLIIANQIQTISVSAQYSMQIMMSFMMFAMIFVNIPTALASAKRINQVLNVNSEANDDAARNIAVSYLDSYKTKEIGHLKEDYFNKYNEKLSISLLKSAYKNVKKDDIKEDDIKGQYYLKYLKLTEEIENKKKIFLDKNNNTYLDAIRELLTHKKLSGVIEFQDVSFQYPDCESPTIEHISFKTSPGKTTAIIGSTGSGKSSLIHLIPRFYDATEGNILFDGINIKEIPETILRDNIGFVPQQALLFKGTIKDNIKFGKKDATDEEIYEALRVAQAENFVSKLPEGLDSYVAQGGKNFSGGQKQRLSIARCLVRKPEIYIFDDSFSALDFKTDAKLRAALKDYTKNSSVIVVAQRVSSIIDADNIIVMNEGKCVGQGTHSELLVNCPIYQDIVKSQLDPEEIEKTIKLSQEALTEGGK